MLDQRKKKLLSSLIQSEGFLTINELSALYSISNRTVRYDLDAIDDWLKNHNFPRLERIPRKGIQLKLTSQDLKLIHQLLEIHDFSQYILTPDERRRLIVLTILNQTTPISASMLAEKMSVSNATISVDLKKLDSMLLQYRLTLKKQPNQLLIVGKERDRRRLISEMLKETTRNQQYLPIKQSLQASLATMKSWFPSVDLNQLMEIIEKTQIDMGVNFSFEATINLIVHLSLAIQRLKRGMDIQIQPSQLKHLQAQKEYRYAIKIARAVSDQYQLKIPEAETAYITYHLMGAKLNRVDSYESYRDQHMNIFPLLDLVIDKVELELNTPIIDRDTLRKDLFLHLVPTIQRLQFGTPMKNPLFEKIVEEYEDLFKICQSALRIIENNLQLSFDKHEASYITMHFAASLHRQSKTNQQYQKILLVCASGIGTSRLLKARLQEYFQNFQVVDSVSVQEVDQTLKENEVDLLITTIPLEKTSVPIVEVSPMLTERELKILSTYLNPALMKKDKEKTAKEIVSDMLPLIQKHMKVKLPSQLEDELLHYFQSDHPNQKRNDVIQLSHIQLKRSCSSWQEAVQMAAEPLLGKDWISQEYIDRVIQDFHNHPSSTMIAPEIAMPHTKSLGQVKQTGFSILTMEKGVVFTQGYPPVKLIIFLAAADQQHVESLAQVIGSLSDKATLKKLLEISEADQAYELLMKKEVNQ